MSAGAGSPRAENHFLGSFLSPAEVKLAVFHMGTLFAKRNFVFCPPKVSYAHPSHLVLLVETHGHSMHLFEMLQRNRSSQKAALILSSLGQPWPMQAGFVSSVGQGMLCPCSQPGFCWGSPLLRLLARVGLGAGSIVLELAGGSFTFPGFMNRFLSRLLLWTSPALESFYGCWSWRRKEPRNCCHFSLAALLGPRYFFPAPLGSFLFSFG